MEKIFETEYPKKLDEEMKKAVASDPIESALSAIKYESLTKFGWDQQDNKVKVYITSCIDGVGKLPKGNVVCDFEDKSLDLKI